MKLKLFKIQKLIKKNLELAFLLLSLIVTILSVRIYNIYKNVALIARKKKCEVIDLELSTITWQYPLMIFMKKDLSNSNIIFRQVNVKNLSKYKKQKIRNFNKKFLCKIVESEKDRNLELR